MWRRPVILENSLQNNFLLIFRSSGFPGTNLLRKKTLTQTIYRRQRQKTNFLKTLIYQENLKT